MAAPQEWRLSQLAALLHYAGWFGLDLLAKVTGANSAEVVEAARFYGIDLRRFDAQAVWCSHCGEVRIYKQGRPGVFYCPVCHARDLVEQARAKEHAALLAVSADQRARLESYATTKGVRRVKREPRPQRADYQPERPRSEYARRAALEQYAADLQAWEYAELWREYRRISRNVERYRKYLDGGGA